MSNRSATRSGPFAFFFILWLLFAVVLIVNPGALDSVWNWVTGLPLILEIIAWVLFLPIMLGLWIWHLDWAVWQRVLVIALIAVVNLSMMSAGSRAAQARKTKASEHNVNPPGSISA